MDIKKLIVTGSHLLSCSSCERTVYFSLSGLPGVKVLSADHKTQKIELILTGETSLEDVEQELLAVGYETERLE